MPEPSRRQQAEALAEALLRGVTSYLLDDGDIVSAAPELIGAICVNSHWDFGELWLYDESRDRLRVCAWGWREQEPEVFIHASRWVEAARGEGLVGRAWASGRPERMLDVRTEPAFGRVFLANELDISEGMAVPLLGNSIVGAFALFRYEVTSQGAAHENLLRHMGMLLGAAIERRSELDGSARQVEHLNAIVNALPVMVWMAGPDKKAHFFNQSWLSFTGRPLAALEGFAWLDCVHPDDFKPRLETLGAAFDARRPFSLEYRLKRHDGAYRWVFDRAAPVIGEGGQLTGYVGAVIDFHDFHDAADARERAAADLESRVTQQKQRAEALEHELDEIIYSISHDLRAPLRSIEGFSNALRRHHVEELTPEGAHFAERIAGSAKRMNQMMEGLLELSRLSRHRLTVAEVDLSALAGDIVDSYRSRESEREVRIVVAAGVVARGDPSLLRVLLSKLIDNAWKFTRGRPHAVIEFGVTNDGSGKQAFFVRDNGAGFAAARQDKALRPFGRLHGEEYGGAGMGLAIAQRIVSAHGGKLWLEAEEDRGATCLFMLGDS